MKRLLKEPNVVIILISAICNLIIDIAGVSSVAQGAVYFFIVLSFLFMDAVKVKSCILIIIFGSILTIINIFQIYGNTFHDWNQVDLFNYKIQGKQYIITKRSIKRSIFLQIMLFSMSAVYTVFKDKEMELLLFATGNIYRETGTASNNVEDKTYSMEIKHEKKKGQQTK